MVPNVSSSISEQDLVTVLTTYLLADSVVRVLLAAAALRVAASPQPGRTLQIAYDDLGSYQRGARGVEAIGRRLAAYNQQHPNQIDQITLHTPGRKPLLWPLD